MIVKKYQRGVDKGYRKCILRSGGAEMAAKVTVTIDPRSMTLLNALLRQIRGMVTADEFGAVCGVNGLFTHYPDPEDRLDHFQQAAAEVILDAINS